ncbi:protein of unknown function [Hyphomicrobium sp. 1Nfss2.1]
MCTSGGRLGETLVQEVGDLWTAVWPLAVRNCGWILAQKATGLILLTIHSESRSKGN